MKLYYMPGACALADHIALEWIAEPYETQKLDHDETKSDWYLKLNPSGQVPVLADGDWVLTQNTAILNYLADTHPQAGLGGDGARGRAEVNRWLGFVNSDVHPAFKPLFGTTGYLSDESAVDETKHQAKKAVRKLLAQANERLADRDWIAGHRSITDPYLYVMLRWAHGMQIDLSDLDHLNAYFERLQNDAGVQKVLKDEGLD
jgi:glutathione S-transferase